MGAIVKWLLILVIALSGPVPVLASAQAATGCAMPETSDKGEGRNSGCCDRSCVLLAGSCLSCPAALAAGSAAGFDHPVSRDVFAPSERSMIVSGGEPPEPPPPRKASR